MKKTLVVVLLLSCMVLLSACDSDTEVTPEGAFLGGTEGVITHFELFGVEEDSVQSIFDTETFPIEVTLQNKGEHELQPGDINVQLLGPAPDEFSGIALRELPNRNILEKISSLNTEGGEETINFASDAQFTEEVTNFLDREWFANVEFNYKTFLVIPEVCLKEDLTDDRVCDVKESKGFFVSGAPITVDSVEEDTAGRGIMALKIAVRNAGSGDVTRPGDEFDDRRSRLVYSIDDPDWECKSAGKVNEARLFNDQAEIICKLREPLAEDTIATKQVKITLDYTYRDLVSETMRIKESR